MKVRSIAAILSMFTFFGANAQNEGSTGGSYHDYNRQNISKLELANTGIGFVTDGKNETVEHKIKGVVSKLNTNNSSRDCFGCEDSIVYDESGNIIFSNSFLKYYNQYDSLGLLRISEVTCGKNTTTYSLSYGYDKDRRELIQTRRALPNLPDSSPAAGPSNHFWFDEQGMLIAARVYDDASEFDYENEYSYDAAGRITTKTRTIFQIGTEKTNSDMPPTDISKYYYNGVLLDSVATQQNNYTIAGNGMADGSSTTIYDLNGLKIQSIERCETGRLELNYTYTYRN